MSDNSNDSNDVITYTKTVPSEPFHIGIRGGTTSHIPLGHFGKNWNGYFTAGLHVDFPTYIPRLFLHFSAEAGDIDKKDLTYKNVTIIHSCVSVSYAIPIIKKLSLRPRLGLLNTLINTQDNKSNESYGIFNDPALFEDSENEFGITGGFDPVYRFSRFQVAVPISYNITFSDPNPIITASISLTAGAVF